MELGNKFWSQPESPCRRVFWKMDYPFCGDANRMMVTIPNRKPVVIILPRAQQRQRTWLDAYDREWPVIPARSTLQFRFSEVHAALRHLVFGRAGFTCQGCGVEAVDYPLHGYDGRAAVLMTNGDSLCVDHVLSRRNGGTNHPQNLQPLCDACNSGKANGFDRIVRQILFGMGGIR